MEDKEMFTVEIINDGKIGKMFTIDLEGLNMLLDMAKPSKAEFRIQKVT